jgi:cytochrome c553
MADVLQRMSIQRNARARARGLRVRILRIRRLRACALGLGAAAMLCVAAHGLADSTDPPTDDRANSPIKSLAATCAGCHGSDGLGTPDAAIPPIAGLAPGRFIESMRAFRDGEGKPTVMRQIAAGYSVAQTRALAEYFAGVTKR